MIHMSTFKSEIDNSSLVQVLQNGPKPQQSILKDRHDRFRCNLQYLHVNMFIFQSFLITIALECQKTITLVSYLSHDTTFLLQSWEM